jgi:enoyl-CoA hydratase
MSGYETILVDTQERVGTITLNRPEVLNALNRQTMRDVVAAAEAFDADPGIGAIVVTGSERAFAAGADITEMEHRSPADWDHDGGFAAWQRFAGVRTPVVAAVSGYALGGGWELALMCDVVLAADSAVFAFPEIGLGVIPGIGGTQRLARAVGAYRAADLVLTGRRIRADEAERIGAVSRVVPTADLLAVAHEVAAGIAARSLPALYAAKDALDAALEGPLAEGLRFESRAFAGLFATDDQKEGMAAFREKREPRFSHR